MTNDEKLQIIKQNEVLIRTIISFYLFPCSFYDPDDCFNDVCWSVFKTLDNYDSNKSKYSTYINCIVKRHIININKRNTNIKNKDQLSYLTNKLRTYNTND